MIKHQIPLIRYWNLLVVFSIGIDAHSGQGMVAFFKFIFHELVISFKTFVDCKQVLFLSHCKFNIIVGTVVADNVVV